MNLDELLSYLRPEEMPDDVACILRIVGPHKFWEIYGMFSGEQIYIPVNCINHAITTYLQHHDVNDIDTRVCARLLGRSRRSIQRLKATSIDETMNLFEEKHNGPDSQ